MKMYAVIVFLVFLLPAAYVRVTKTQDAVAETL